LKMEMIQGSETSANYNLTPGKYPEENIQYFFASLVPPYVTRLYSFFYLGTK